MIYMTKNFVNLEVSGNICFYYHLYTSYIFIFILTRNENKNRR